MKLHVYWTYTRPNDRLVANDVLEYARKKPKLDTEIYHAGGLGHTEDLFTHFLDREGKIHVLRPQTENKFRNTFSNTRRYKWRLQICK